MAFALHVQTESSDNYVFAFDGEPSQEEIIKQVKEKLDEEFEYISGYDFDATYKIKFKMKLNY